MVDGKVWAGRACETLGVQDNRAIIWFERLCLDSADQIRKIRRDYREYEAFVLTVCEWQTGGPGRFGLQVASQHHLAGNGQAHIVEHTGFRRKGRTTQRRAEADGTSVIHTDNVRDCCWRWVRRRRLAQTPVRVT